MTFQCSVMPWPLTLLMLLIVFFPFIALAILQKHPFLPVIFFYTPLGLSLILTACGLVNVVRFAPPDPRLWTFDMFAWGLAECLAVIAFGAGSCFIAALFNLRVRRRAMYPVFPITLAIAAAAWLGAHALLARM